MTVYIVTTSSAPLEYRQVSKPKTGKDNKQTSPPKVLQSVTINGGANISQGIGLVTPHGISTAISDDDYEWLKDDSSFKRHIKNGFMKVLEKDESADAVAGSMEKFDGSAPQNVDSGGATHVPQASEG